MSWFWPGCYDECGQIIITFVGGSSAAASGNRDASLLEARTEFPFANFKRERLPIAPDLKLEVRSFARRDELGQSPERSDFLSGVACLHVPVPQADLLGVA